MSEENKEVNDFAKQLEEMKAQMDEMQRVNKDLQDQVIATKKHNDTLLQEKRQEKEKLTNEVLQVEAKTKEQWEQKEAAYKAALSERDQILAEREQREAAQRLDSEARKIAAQLTTNANKQEVLAGLLKQRIKLDGDNIQVLDEKGNLTISPVETLVESAKKQYDFLVDGVVSSGSGAAGSTVSASKAIKDMTTAEKVDYYNRDPASFDQQAAQEGVLQN